MKSDERPGIVVPAKRTWRQGAKSIFFLASVSPQSNKSSNQCVAKKVERYLKRKIKAVKKRLIIQSKTSPNP